MGNNSASTEYLTLQPPNAMGTSYTVTLPPPNSSGSTAILTYDTSNDILVGPSLSSITTGVNPAGALVMYGGTSAPTGYLLCDGTSYLRATYPILFTAIGTAYGTADGTHFNVPDMRGMFPRGTDNGAGNDPDASSRTAANPGGNTGDNVGSFESWATETHHHQVTNYANTNPGGGVTQATITVGAGVANTTNNTGQFSTETRPINVYVNFIIKT